MYSAANSAFVADVGERCVRNVYIYVDALNRIIAGDNDNDIELRGLRQGNAIVFNAAAAAASCPFGPFRPV